MFEIKKCDNYISRSNIHVIYLQRITKNTLTFFDAKQLYKVKLKVNLGFQNQVFG